MKINTEVARPVGATEANSTAKTSGSVPAAKAASATPAVGSVKISEASRSLQAAGTSNAEAPFDAKRVDAIKDAISSGQFKVNPEKIADKVLDSANQLLVGKS